MDPAHPALAWGDLYIDGAYFCCTLEDQVRERPGLDVYAWKVPHLTAIPSGIFGVRLEDSPHFGANTPTLLNVPGFEAIRIHGGTSERDTEGCPLVGSRQDRIDGTLHGAKVEQRFGGVIVSSVLPLLQAKLMAAVARKDSIHIQVRNGPLWYRANGLQMPAPLP